MNDAGRIGFVTKGDYDASVTYEYLDVVYFEGASYVAKRTTLGNTPGETTEYWQTFVKGGSLTETGDISNTTVDFDVAESRENIVSGETQKILFGKIKKWFTDLKSVAFSGNYNDLEDIPEIPAAIAVKGNKETTYRTGNVNLTPENLGALSTEGDSANNTVSFTSSDSTDPDTWTDVSVLKSGEKHNSIISKTSTMFKNIRYLYKVLGNTDISKIGNGTLTNAVSTLNSNLSNLDSSIPKSIILTGDVVGNGSFNNSGEVNITAKRRSCYTYRGGNISANVNPWYKIASISVIKGQFADYSISFLVNYAYNNNTTSGIVRCMARTGSTGLEKKSIVWELNNGIDLNNAVLVSYENSGLVIIEFWYYSGTKYQTTLFEVLAEASSISNGTNIWTLYTYSQKEGLAAIPSNYSQVVSTLATIQNPIDNVFNKFQSFRKSTTVNYYDVLCEDGFYLLLIHAYNVASEAAKQGGIYLVGVTSSNNTVGYREIASYNNFSSITRIDGGFRINYTANVTPAGEYLRIY